MKHNTLWGLIIIAGLSAAHNNAVAASVTIKRPAAQQISNTENDIRHGEIIINATVYNAPCNLQVTNTQWPILTGCGAGSDFRKINVQNALADSPATARFYHTQQKQYSRYYSLRLENGSNILKHNENLNSRTPSRLEITYE